MEPDFTMVSNLPLPMRLLKLIETGRWPRTHEEELLGIPVKVNIDSGGKPNGIPERR